MLLFRCELQTHADVVERGRKCATGTAVVASLSSLSSIGLAGISFYCTLLLAGVAPPPVPLAVGYGWVYAFGDIFLYTSSANTILHIIGIVSTREHARRIQSEFVTVVGSGVSRFGVALVPSH